MKCKSISGVILAGGANKRFDGVIKAKLLIDGKPIIARIIDILEKVFVEIIIVTNTPDEFPEYEKYKIVGDIYSNAGPLAGIHSALRAASGDSVFVFAGDMPYLNKELILSQIDLFNSDNPDVLIPKIGTSIEPLHGIYSSSVSDSLERFLANGKSKAVRDFLELVTTSYMQLEPANEMKRAFTNINSPSDVDFY